MFDKDIVLRARLDFQRAEEAYNIGLFNFENRVMTDQHAIKALFSLVDDILRLIEMEAR